MNVTKVSDHMQPGQVWISEWDVEWKVIEVAERHAVVKRIGGRSLHHVTMRDVQDWERQDAAAMREP